MRIRILAVAALAACMGGGPAGATLVGEADVPAMVEAADVIVVGRAHGISIRNGAASVSQTFAIAVDRVLKGAASEASHRIRVRHAVLDAGGREIVERQYGIFFLSREHGVYSPVDPQHPALAASPGGGKAAPADPLAGVAGELAEVLAAAADTLVSKTAHREAAEALGALPYEVAGQSLRALADSDGVPASLWALSSLFRMSDKERLESYLANRLRALAPALLDPAPDTAEAVATLAAAMRGRLTSAQATAALARLLGSRDVSVRRAAASALGDIEGRSAVRPLAEIALDDEDREVRYFAVLGLHDATGIGEAPALTHFKRSESATLRFWRGWARVSLR